MAKKNRVLLVDDDASSLAMLGLSLRQEGFIVRTASSGEEALRRLRRERFDWMVTDGRMMPMDGFETSVAAKRLQPKLRIVMISATDLAAEIASYPIEALFPKPVPLESLVQWLGGAYPQ